MGSLEKIKINWSEYMKYMSKPKMTYFKDEDVLHIVVSDEKEVGSIELNPNITAELNENGELI